MQRELHDPRQVQLWKNVHNNWSSLANKCGMYGDKSQENVSGNELQATFHADRKKEKMEKERVVPKARAKA